MSNHVHVIVFSPREPRPREFDFPSTETVGAAASTAGTAFGYPAGLNLTFERGKTVLNRGETLAAAGVHNGDKLELVDTGGGV
jgi:hypothetical protein